MNGEPAEQVTIAGAAATDEDAFRIGRMIAYVHRDRPRCQFCQGRLHIGRFIPVDIEGGEPIEIEVLETGALGRVQAKIGERQQLLEQVVDDHARRRPGAVLVKTGASMPVNPAIHERVAGPGIEAGHWLPVRGQNGDVGDAADVEDYPAFARGPEPPVVKGRERSALAAGRDVGAAKISNRGYAGSGRDDVGIADLQGVRPEPPWLVPDRLAMAADCVDCGGGDAALPQEPQHDVAKLFTHLSIETADVVDGFID